MRYIKRHAETLFLQWKRTCRDHSHKLALLVTGSRQVGKTTAVQHFANEQYKNVIYVDVKIDSKLAMLTRLSHDDVCSGVENYCAARGLTFSNDQNTVIIIDEVQESKELYERIRLFNRQLDCDLIVTGSNLTKAINYFQPVGDTQEIRMFPLSFEEYLDYYGAYDYYLSHSIETICNEKLDWFRNVYQVYCIVGGYPYVFNTYLDGGSVEDAFHNLVESYKREFSAKTNDPADYGKIETMFYTICDIMCREKKGMPRSLDTVSKLTTQSNSLRISTDECNHILSWLGASGIVDFCDKVDLRDNRRYASERFYMDDIGLLNYICKLYRMDSHAVDGAVAENFAYKVLLNKYDAKCFYGVRPAFAVLNNNELDFIVQSRVDDCVYGVEVKSGKNSGKSMQAVAEKGFVDYTVYAKGMSGFGTTETSITIPIFLLGKFNFGLGGVKEPDSIEKISIFH